MCLAPATIHPPRRFSGSFPSCLGQRSLVSLVSQESLFSPDQDHSQLRIGSCPTYLRGEVVSVQLQDLAAMNETSAASLLLFSLVGESPREKGGILSDITRRVPASKTLDTEYGRLHLELVWAGRRGLRSRHIHKLPDGHRHVSCLARSGGAASHCSSTGSQVLSRREERSRCFCEA